MSHLFSPLQPNKIGIKTPLGVLSLAQVEKGDAVLDRIQSVLSGSSKESLVELSSEYYTKIPHSHGRTKPPVINTMEMYHQKLELSQLMKDMLKVSSEGHASILIEDDVDEKYAALGAEIEVVEKNSTEFNNLMEHVRKNRHHQDQANFSNKGDGFDPKAKCGPVKHDVSERVVNVFKVTRQDEVKRYKGDKLGNEHLLFHASRFTNWVGILSRGILLPDAVTKLGIPRTDFGWLGAGIYFGAQWSTSENYCGVGKDGTGCMMVLKGTRLWCVCVCVFWLFLFIFLHSGPRKSLGHDQG